MQLSFLGKSYTASTTAIDATVTNETAVFRGHSYARRQFKVTQRYPSDELTYRGVRFIR